MNGYVYVPALVDDFGELRGGFDSVLIELVPEDFANDGRTGFKRN